MNMSISYINGIGYFVDLRSREAQDEIPTYLSYILSGGGKSEFVCN